MDDLELAVLRVIEHPCYNVRTVRRGLVVVTWTWYDADDHLRDAAYLLRGYGYQVRATPHYRPDRLYVRSRRTV